MKLSYPNHRSGIYGWNLVEILEQFKHPRWNAIGVECTIYGNAPREKAGIAPSGTVWVAPAAVYYDPERGWLADEWGKREFLFAIRKGSIPAQTTLEARFDENMARWVPTSKGGEITRGWVPLLRDLLKGGHLRPHPELSLLIGQDSTNLCPREYRI